LVVRAGIILLAWLYINFSEITFNFIILVKETSAHISVSQMIVLDALGKEEKLM